MRTVSARNLDYATNEGSSIRVENGMDTPICAALSTSKVVNNEGSFNSINKVGYHRPDCLKAGGPN